MSENVREEIKEHHGFYEVGPYWVLLQERLQGTTATTRRIQAGFDIDVYGNKIGDDAGSSLDYGQLCKALQQVVETVLPQTSDSCSIEVIPFGSTVVFDTRRHLESEAMVRIRITHGRGLDHPSGAAEEGALKEIEEQLRKMGVTPAKNRD